MPKDLGKGRRVGEDVVGEQGGLSKRSGLKE